MKRFIFTLAALCLATTSAFATDKSKLYIAATIGADGHDDPVGAEYVYHLRETVASSSVYQLTKSLTDSMYVLNLATIDPTRAVGMPGQMTAISVILCFNVLPEEDACTVFLSQWVVTIGRQNASVGPVQLMAAIDKQVNTPLTPVQLKHVFSLVDTDDLKGR
jgi:hypothetical protein